MMDGDNVTAQRGAVSTKNEEDNPEAMCRWQARILQLDLANSSIMTLLVCAKQRVVLMPAVAGRVVVAAYAAVGWLREATIRMTDQATQPND